MTKPIELLRPEEESLAEFTEQARKAPVIDWYRTPLNREKMKALHQRSDFKGFLQTGGHLALLCATGGTAIYSAYHWPWWVTAAVLFLHGTVCSFMINAVHELGHGTVFKTRWLNNFFCPIFAFLGWHNHNSFQASHIRHHRYTLHPPDDLEVVLPVPLMIRHVLTTGIVWPVAFWNAVKITIRIARGKFCGEWEKTLFPESDPEIAWPTIRWARILLIGHGAIVAVSLAFGWWMVPVVVTMPQFYGGWLFFLCNNTQHVGLKDNVPDFRLCCRTFTLNPVARFLYWQMNYHTEHHMYAAVPCYNLSRLHRTIKHDLPHIPHGLFEVWREIAAILNKQEKDPFYQHQVPLREGAAPARLA